MGNLYIIKYNIILMSVIIFEFFVIININIDIIDVVVLFFFIRDITSGTNRNISWYGLFISLDSRNIIEYNESSRYMFFSCCS